MTRIKHLLQDLLGLASRPLSSVDKNSSQKLKMVDWLKFPLPELPLPTLHIMGRSCLCQLLERGGWKGGGVAPHLGGHDKSHTAIKTVSKQLKRHQNTCLLEFCRVAIFVPYLFQPALKLVSTGNTFIVRTEPMLLPTLHRVIKLD